MFQQPVCIIGSKRAESGLRLAKKEMEYWLTEAEEWKRLKESLDLSTEEIPLQIDWCADSNDHRPRARLNERAERRSNV